MAKFLTKIFKTQLEKKFPHQSFFTLDKTIRKTYLQSVYGRFVGSNNVEKLTSVHCTIRSIKTKLLLFLMDSEIKFQTMMNF